MYYDKQFALFHGFVCLLYWCTSESQLPMSANEGAVKKTCVDVQHQQGQSTGRLTLGLHYIFFQCEIQTLLGLCNRGETPREKPLNIFQEIKKTVIFYCITN